MHCFCLLVVVLCVIQVHVLVFKNLLLERALCVYYNTVKAWEAFKSFLYIL